MSKLIRALLCASGMVLLTGCVWFGDKLDQFRWHFTTVPFFVFDNAKNYVEPPQRRVLEDDVSVAIAISGGGSRSAVFAAGVMEQLAHIPDPTGRRQTVLDRCDVISAVSGGSLAAAYYALYKPTDFSNPDVTTDFFQCYKSHMTVDFFARGWVHYLSHPWEAAMKYYTRYRFVQTLANTFDQYLFQGADFGHLSEREITGESPAVMLNSASLDTGKKFLFTNLNVQKNLAFDPRGIGGSPAMQMLAQAAASPIYGSFGFDSIDSDISSFRLSSAIAASSAYPILPGPAALMDYCTNGYVHLADGGINDNFGIDAIIQLYLAREQFRESRGRLVVLSIDVTTPLEPKKVGDPNGYVSTITYGQRATTALAARGQTLATVLYQGQESITIIPIALRDCPQAAAITSELASYSISEKEMLLVLDAAICAAQGKRAEIEAAVAGAALPAGMALTP